MKGELDAVLVLASVIFAVLALIILGPPEVDAILDSLMKVSP